MTDNEIIKALECCINIDCHICPFMINSKECNNIESLVLDLINRQKAEIERLTEEINALNGNTEKYIAECEKRSREIAEDYRKEIKSEAIREFANKVKRRLNSNSSRGAYLINIVNDIVKEMTEDGNGNNI